MEHAFSYETRSANIAMMATQPVDLLVIGAGITGAGIARDAAMRGIQTAIVDKGDFGSGTSSRSTRLVHGGLRYLEHGRLRLVREACRERSVLLRIAPHLVWPRAFLFPVHEGARVSRWRLAAGMWLYDLLATFGGMGRHKLMGVRAMRRAEPRLKSRGLKGGARYFDAQCDDARLTLANVRSAHQHGALAANYLQVDRLEVADGQIRGAKVTDLVTGSSHTVHTHIVVNATGPWSDRFRAQEQEGDPVLRPTNGVHIAVPRHRMGNQEALTITSPVDGRVMFIIPWGGLSYVGSTDVDCLDPPEEIYASGDDVVYLLRSANALFPDARLTPEDVVATWAGVRPLVASSELQDSSAVSREHRMVESPSGLISVVGGMLTNHRAMAAEAVGEVGRRLHELDGRPVPDAPDTHREALPGGEARDLTVLTDEAEREGIARETAEHLVQTFGSETPAVIRLAQARPELSRPIVTGHPAIRAELVHAMRREMALTLGDLLIRRIHLFYEAEDHALDQISSIAQLAAAEMEWEPDRKAAELAAYINEVDLTMAFRTELGSVKS